MSEQGTVVRPHGRAETFHHGDAVEGEGRDWPLAAPIFAAVVGIYAAAVVGIYELVASTGRQLLAYAGAPHRGSACDSNQSSAVGSGIRQRR